MRERLLINSFLFVLLVLMFSMMGCYFKDFRESADNNIMYLKPSSSGKIGGVELRAGSGTGKPWFFNLHPEDVNYDITQADEAFDRILALGGRGVRTDVCWYDVEPSRDTYSASMVNFYKEFFAHAVAKGLSCMAILGGWGRTPSWAQSLYDSDPQAFCDEFLEFCQYVASQVGDNVLYYQIWNEANHPSDGIDSDNDWVVMWYGGKGVKNADPTSIRFVNVFCNVTGWTDTVESWFNNLANYETVIDGLGIDHYPGTWAAGDGSDWYPLGIYHTDWTKKLAWDDLQSEIATF